MLGPITRSIIAAPRCRQVFQEHIFNVLPRKAKTTDSELHGVACSSYDSCKKCPNHQQPIFLGHMEYFRTRLCVATEKLLLDQEKLATKMQYCTTITYTYARMARAGDRYTRT